ncbi:hypothetical protein Ade02nite_96130 [Paractinoplanes deccanensis]|uniref:Uncharacterized protein n=1 Tax=Paractinoplanes deccanensis TaxID=113561 RepID=A0ABQ3YLU3_9ACTN|nr:hypothetical protein [Actinoplanes deccanensis]GID80972.1 hypothetical protein Ade02nite_96130 [Actinoplanes deccanensis]
MRRTSIRTVLTVAFVAAMAALAPGGVAVAAPAEPPAFCAVLAQPAAQRNDGFPEMACSGKSAAAAKAGLRTAAASRLLMTYYSDAGWKGRSLNVYGAYGICDGDGYEFNLDSYWSTNISAIRGYQQCNGVGVWGRTVGYGHTALSWSFGATVWNDNVRRVWVHCITYVC